MMLVDIVCSSLVNEAVWLFAGVLTDAGSLLDVVTA
jgi:hypothetical protein